DRAKRSGARGHDAGDLSVELVRDPDDAVSCRNPEGAIVRGAPRIRAAVDRAPARYPRFDPSGLGIDPQDLPLGSGDPERAVRYGDSPRHDTQQRHLAHLVRLRIDPLQMTAIPGRPNEPVAGGDHDPQKLALQR